jgi:hypothetical protein
MKVLQGEWGLNGSVILFIRYKIYTVTFYTFKLYTVQNLYWLKKAISSEFNGPILWTLLPVNWLLYEKNGGRTAAIFHLRP